jgi:hypothetical protein
MHRAWMWRMDRGHAIGVLFIALVIAALIKYIFFD